MRSDSAPAPTPLKRESLVFGSASIGNLYREVSDAQAHEVLSAAWDAGIRSFDTAPHYGLGLSERRLGAFLATRDREAFHLSTKVGRVLEDEPDFTGATDEENGFVVPASRRRVFDPTADGVHRSIDDSLVRMGLERIDTALLHDPDVYDLDAGLRLALPALAALRAEGLVSEIGIGVNSTHAAVRAVREGDIDVVMIAGRYTLIDQRADEELLALCIERGVRVIAVGVFNSGLLAAADPAAARFDYGTVPDALVARVQELHDLCRPYGVPLAAAALQFPLRHPAVGRIAIGTAVAAELDQNLGLLECEIPDALWDEIAAATR